MFSRLPHFSVHKNIVIDKNGYTTSKYGKIFVVLSSWRLNEDSSISPSHISRFPVLQWKLCLRGCSDHLGCEQVGRPRVRVSHLLSFAEASMALDQMEPCIFYRSLSGKSVGENKYCAEMNAKTSKFYHISFPESQLLLFPVKSEAGHWLLFCTISHQQLYRTVALPQTLLTDHLWPFWPNLCLHQCRTMYVSNIHSANYCFLISPIRSYFWHVLSC